MQVYRLSAALVVVFVVGATAGFGVPAGPDLSVGLGPVGEAAGDHGEPSEETTLVEVQTVTGEGTDPGELDVELDYHVGEAIVELDVQLVTDGVVVVGLDGFDQTDENTYTWDEQTSEPSIRLVVEANRTRAGVDGYDFVDTAGWTLTGPVDTTATIRSVEEGIEREVFVRSDEHGTSGQRLIYLGEYEDATFGSDRTVRIVVVDDANPAIPVEEIGAALVDVSELLDVGGEHEQVTGFVVTDPLRHGGLASGADFWVHEATLFEPRPTLYHEYVHTRQVADRADSAAWTDEAEAEYYSFLLALKLGDVEYHDFHDFFADADADHADVVLADPATWEGTHPEDGTRADYELGGLAIAALDAEIRAESDGTRSYEDVFRAINDHDGEVTETDLERFAAEAAGTDVSEFFETHVRSPPGSLSLPSPSIYDAPAHETTLAVETVDATVGPGEWGALVFEVTNSGDETSLAPFVEISFPVELDSGDVTVDEFRGVDSGVTSTGDGWVLDHLDPGETVVLEYDVGALDGDRDAYTVDATVTDLGGAQTTGSVVVEVRTTPDAALDVPAGFPAGEPVLLDASASSDSAGIAAYHWEILGPIDETDSTNGPDAADSTDSPGILAAETTEPELEHVFEAPGEYRVVVTVENVDGATATVTETVVASDRPGVTVDAPSTVEAGEAFFLNATVENDHGAYEVRWEVGDEVATGERLELTLAQSGEREITVTVEDEYGATVTETVVVTVDGGDGHTTDGATDERTADDTPGDDSDAFGPGLGVVTALTALVLVCLGSWYWKSL